MTQTYIPSTWEVRQKIAMSQRIAWVRVKTLSICYQELWGLRTYLSTNIQVHISVLPQNFTTHQFKAKLAQSSAHEASQISEGQTRRKKVSNIWAKRQQFLNILYRKTSKGKNVPESLGAHSKSVPNGRTWSSQEKTQQVTASAVPLPSRGGTSEDVTELKPLANLLQLSHQKPSEFKTAPQNTNAQTLVWLKHEEERD